MTTEFSILRPHYFMQNLFSEVIDSTISLPAGDGKIGMIDARDIASVAAKLLLDESPLRRTAELTGPEPVSFSRVAAAVGAATGTRTTYFPTTEQEYVEKMVSTGHSSAEDARVIARVYQDVEEGILDVHTDEVEQITGKKPRSIEHFAVDYAAQFLVLNSH